MPKPKTAKDKRREPVNDLVNEFLPKSKWKMRCSCHGRNCMDMKPGDSWGFEGKVYAVKRVRRQWEEPGKEVVFECVDGGYYSLLTSTISKIEDKGKFIRVILKDNSKVFWDYYRIDK